MLAAMVTWSLLFLPITLFGVQPMIEEISSVLDQPRLIELTPEILFGSIGMHVIYGGMLGLMCYMAIVPTATDYEETNDTDREKHVE